MSRTFYEDLRKSEYLRKPYQIKQGGDYLLVSQLLEDAEIINIQNVWDYVLSINDTASPSNPVEWKWDDFPNLAPPFETFFMEFQFTTGYRGGCLFHASEDDNKWLMSVSYFQEQYYGDRKVCVPGPHMLRLEIDKSGRLLEIGKRSPVFWKESDLPTNEDWLWFDTRVEVPVFLAISFLHCKNVVLEEHHPSVPGKRNRHGPHITFKTLNIKPMQKVLRDEGNAETTGLKMALHICRGHFKTFSGKGLFGKYTGTYWWDSQVRGKAESGIVIKDYEV